MYFLFRVFACCHHRRYRGFVFLNSAPFQLRRNGAVLSSNAKKMSVRPSRNITGKKRLYLEVPFLTGMLDRRRLSTNFQPYRP